MSRSACALETFLNHYHDEFPGGTSESLANIPVLCEGLGYRSSYDFLVSNVLEPKKSINILDIACGDGFLLKTLEESLGLNHIYAGVDFSAGELKRAAQRLGSDAKLVRARAQDLPYSSDQFDYVLSHLALMLMPDVERVVEEIARVLKPNGKLLAVVGGRAPVSPVQQVFLDVISDAPRDRKFQNVSFAGNPLRDAQGIQKLLSHSFEVECVKRLDLTISRNPIGMWDWFSQMYDVALVDVTAKNDLKKTFFEEVESLESIENLAHGIVFYYFSAKALESST